MRRKMLYALLLALVIPIAMTAQPKRVSVNAAAGRRPVLAVIPANVPLQGSGAARVQGLSDNQRLLGYTVTDDIDVNGGAFGAAGTYSIGAVFTPQMLASYAGCPVVGIRIAVAMNLGRTRTFIYTADEAGMTAVVEQNQRLYEGWNNVFFNNPYEIKGSETLFFGFDYVETPEMVSADQGGLCGAGEEQDGSFYLYGEYNGRLGLYSLSGIGRLCVQLIVDVSSLPLLDLDLTYLDTGFKYKQPGDTIEGMATFANVGREAAENYQLGYKLDDRQPVFQDIVSDSKLAVGQSDSWMFKCPLPKDLSVGLHSLRVFVSQVGGESLAANSHSDTLKADFAVYQESVERSRAYFEVYTDQSSPYAAWLNEALNVVMTTPLLSEKLALVNVHRPGTPLAVSEAAYLHTLYAYTWPTFTVNRAYFPGEAYVAYDMNDFLAYQPLIGADFSAGIIRDIILQDYYSPSFASVALQTDYDEQSRQLTVTATGDVLPEAEAIYGHLALTLILVEDSVNSSQVVYNPVTERTTTQRSYTHRQVLRGYLTSPIGDALEVNGREYSQSVTATLPQAFDAKHVSVVALLTKQADAVTEANVRDYDVINADMQPLFATSAVAAVAADGRQAPAACYSLDGRRLPTSASPHGLVLQRQPDGSVRKVVLQR